MCALIKLLKELLGGDHTPPRFTARLVLFGENIDIFKGMEPGYLDREILWKLFLKRIVGCLKSYWLKNLKRDIYHVY